MSPWPRSRRVRRGPAGSRPRLARRRRSTRSHWACARSRGAPATGPPCRPSARGWALGGRGSRGAHLAGAQQAIAQLALLLGTGVERDRVGQAVEAREPEETLEERRRPVEDRAELRAPGILDQAALLE